MYDSQREPLQPDDLGIILSYCCQSQCKHCLYNCGPFWREWMKPEDVRAALQTARTWSKIPQVHFTGGEPFLNFPLLSQAAGFASELGFAAYVETNAGWCVDTDLVYDRFEALQKAGLAAVLISCSPFHAETIPLHRTLLAINAALDVFGLNGVMVYMPDWIEQIHRFSLHEPVPLETYLNAYGHDPAGVLFWDGYCLIAGGRAGYLLGEYTDLAPAVEFSSETCRLDLLHAHHSHFDLYGNFIAGFCGGLRLGSWRDLPGIIASTQLDQASPLIKLLVEGGPYRLYEWAKDTHGYTARHEGYAGKCHLCVDVRRHLAHKQTFAELQPAGFYENLPG